MLRQSLYIFSPLPAVAHAQSYISAECDGDLTNVSLKKIELSNLNSYANTVYFVAFQISRQGGIF